MYSFTAREIDYEDRCGKCDSGLGRVARVRRIPDVLRDLSISPDNVGNTDRALGDLEQARAAFAEGLEFDRRLAAALPRHTDYKDLPGWLENRLTELSAAAEEGPAGVDRSGRDTIEK